MTPIFSLTPLEAIHLFGRPFEPADHHFTGPVTAQMCEGQGSVFHEEGRVLAAIARKRGGPVLEIGGDCGISTRYILEGLGSDSWIDTIDITHRWDAAIYSPQIAQHTCKSHDFTSFYSYPWAFIDGDHQYAAVQGDIDVALRHDCRLLVFHDAGPNHAPAIAYNHGSDVRPAVLDYDWPAWSLFDVSTRLGLLIAAAA